MRAALGAAGRAGLSVRMSSVDGTKRVRVRPRDAVRRRGSPRDRPRRRLWCGISRTPCARTRSFDRGTESSFASAAARTRSRCCTAQRGARGVAPRPARPAFRPPQTRGVTEERAFVEALRARLRAEVHVRVPDSPFADASFQANARSWRRSEARALRERVDAHVILQGHHADDQTETILHEALSRVPPVQGGRIALIGVRETAPRLPKISVDIVPGSSIGAVERGRLERGRGVPSKPGEARLGAGAERGDARLVEDRLRALTAQSAHLREWLDDVPKPPFRARSGLVLTSESSIWTCGSRFPRWRGGPTVRLRREVHRESTRIPQPPEDHGADALDERGMELAPRERLGARARGSARSRGRSRRSPSSRPRPATTRVRRRRLRGGAGGLPVGRPPGWTVRAAMNDDDVARGPRARRSGWSQPRESTRGVFAGSAVSEARRSIPPRTRDAPVRLKDWMRDAAVPLHERDRTPVVTLGEEVLAVYPSSVSARAPHRQRRASGREMGRCFTSSSTASQLGRGGES